MQAYYLKLRKDPPPHGNYNPLQKAAYTTICSSSRRWSCSPGLALSPGIDAIANPLTVVCSAGGSSRGYGTSSGMLALIAFFARPHLPRRLAGLRQSNALDDHRAGTAPAYEGTGRMKRSLFIASSIVAALTGCAPIGTALNGNAGFQSVLESAEGLNHAVDRHARPRAALYRQRRRPRISASTASTRRPTRVYQRLARRRLPLATSSSSTARSNGGTRFRSRELQHMRLAHADHAPRLRRRLERDRQVERRAARRRARGW